MWKGETEREWRDSGAFLFEDYLWLLPNYQHSQLATDDFNLVLTQALISIDTYQASQDKVDVIVHFLNTYAGLKLRVNDGNVRGLVHLLQGLRDPRAGDWFRIGSNVYRHLSEMTKTRTICVETYLTVHEIQVLVDESMKEIGNTLKEMDRLYVERLGNPTFEGEDLNDRDLQIVERYTLKIEIDDRKTAKSLILTGIPSIDNVITGAGATTKVECRKRIAKALHLLGLSPSPAHHLISDLNLPGRRVMRYLFEKVLRL